MKLSVLTPLPPAPTGIADYSETLLRELHQCDGIELEAVSPEPASPQPFPVRKPDELGEIDAQSLAMYHVGNSEHHDFMFPAIFDRPGVVVLHDLVVHHARLISYLKSDAVLAYQRDLGNRDKRARAHEVLDAYRAEAADAYPDTGAAIAEIAIRMGGGNLLYAYPMYEHLVRRSRLTLVHSRSARDEIIDRCPDSNVERVRMGVHPPEPEDREAAREKLGLPPGLVLASFGLVTPEKRIDMALSALARLAANGVDARYLLVGGTVDHYDVRARARAFGVDDRVVLAGRVPEETFWRYAFAADVCLNLRYPSAGETSATLLRLLACGRPVMVTDQVHVSDFPETVVARASLDGDEDGLYCDLMDLIRADNRRRSLGEAARRFIQREHTVSQMVSDYRDALGNI